MNRLLVLYWKFERYVIVLVLLMSLSLQNAKSQDSLQVAPSNTKIIRMDSLSFDSTKSVVVVKHSATKAALLSAVLPGLGQIYNKKYWKLPLVYAGVGISAYFFITNQQKYKKYNDAWVNYSNGNPKDYRYVKDLTEIPKWYFDNNQVDYALSVLTNGYRRNRDWSLVFTAGFYILGIIDAAVDAYLFDYDISDKLSLNAQPVMTNTIAGTNAFGLKLSFNLH